MADNIYQKLAKIRKLVEALQKNKQGHNYKYVTEDEILAKVTGGMEKHGLSLIPNILHNTTTVSPYQYGKTKVTKDGQIYEEKVNEILVQADMEWIWVNNENPDEKVVVPWIIIGHQQNASMAFGSGLSYTVRYFLLKYFNVSTLEDDVDAWKVKQREVEQQEELEAIKAVVNEIDKLAKDYVEKKPDNGKLLGKTLKKLIKNENGKPTANYFEITTIETATTVKTKLEDMISSEKNQIKKKKAGIKLGFKTGSFCKIWKIEDKGNYSDVQLSISKKNKQTDQYETEFSSIVRFIGTAHNDIKKYSEGSRIKLGECDVTNSYDKEKKIVYTNYKVFSFDNADTAQQTDSSQSSTAASKTPPKETNKPKVETNEETGLPF